MHNRDCVDQGQIALEKKQHNRALFSLCFPNPEIIVESQIFLQTD